MQDNNRGAVQRIAGTLLSRMFFRLTVCGEDAVPQDGPALLVSNHVTGLDPFLIQRCLSRPVRFVVSHETLAHPRLGPLYRASGAISVSPSDARPDQLAALEEARRALDAGEIVCLFAEGALTRNGLMRPLLPALDEWLPTLAAPVVPVYIANAWGHCLSRAPLRSHRSAGSALRHRVLVAFGAARPVANAEELRQAVREQSCEAFHARKDPRRTLPYQFIRAARRHRFRTFITDTGGRRFRFGQTLTAALALAAALKRRTAGEDTVGVLLPTSTGAALANLALALNGQVVVNLNFTASREALASAMQQSGIRTIVSARAFVEQAGDFGLQPHLLLLEDIVEGLHLPNRLAALARAVFWPAHRLAPAATGPDSVAAILFSSGSTGLPKGVQLTHHNLISNIESFRWSLDISPADRMCAALPFFHSFGFTTHLWAPALLGCSAHYHTSPLDGATIVDLVRRQHCTILLATPTFLMAYIRRGSADDFHSLRAVATGAEKLPARIADAFERRFGLRPLEGYGATELSPVVSLNIPDVEGGDVPQTGTKEGSIGHPIAGVVAHIRHIETAAPLAVNEEGLLWIKGPNVMHGYLGNPEATREVLRDGWYNTGDVARMDRDGFLFIVDRLSRYSKIGGEMVPHLAIEDHLAAALNLTDRAVVVTGAPDERKGEQLVVLYTPVAGDRDALIRCITQSDLPNLWRPRKDNFLNIPELPLLASGKLDLKRIRDVAREFVERRPSRGQRALDALRNSL